MGSTSRSAPPDPDALYDALSNPRRRACLNALNAAKGELPVRELARSITDETTGDPDRAAKSTYVSLIQTHLPKLAAYDIITYDETEKIVAPGPAYPQAYACLTAHTGDPDSKPSERLPVIFWGISLGALTIALIVPPYTRHILWFVLALQLIGTLITITASR